MCTRAWPFSEISVPQCALSQKLNLWERVTYRRTLYYRAAEARKRKDLGSILLRLSFLVKKVVVCGHWWLCPSLPTETLKWLSSLPVLMQESVWWWQCSDRYIILSLFPHLHTHFPPFSPSLTSLMVSVDVKHHVYLLRAAVPQQWGEWPLELIHTCSQDRFTTVA